jgi:hypothetical protein
MRVARLTGANAAVQREQEEESHQRLGALNDVGDARGLQRMDEPDSRYRHREPARGLSVSCAEFVAFQHSPHDAEQQEPARI